MNAVDEIKEIGVRAIGCISKRGSRSCNGFEIFCAVLAIANENSDGVSAT
ncbi:hypothetical protein A2U01_0064762 [Trifolium medium]|uniref:Uncharacterized protein n=1 Tax=Trifolium medium TaxID=97028 RepID=A0A392S6K8_9FABA|nr:hypothetical protein [Trifolium medium]